MKETELLEARRAAIEKCVEECGGEKDASGNTEPTRGLLVMLAEKAAGHGFDAGVKYMCCKPKFQEI